MFFKRSKKAKKEREALAVANADQLSSVELELASEETIVPASKNVEVETKPATKAKAPAKKPAATKAKAPAKKPAAKAKDSETTTTEKTKTPTNIYYVTARYEYDRKVGWEIKRGRASKVSAFVKTKEEAKAKVKELAKHSFATVIIYKRDGSVDETYKIKAQTEE